MFQELLAEIVVPTLGVIKTGLVQVLELLKSSGNVISRAIETPCVSEFFLNFQNLKIHQVP